ncbi:hypothetical protein ACNKHT_14370 [Shigella flexneri]
MILNYIANYIIQNNAINRTSSASTLTCAKGRRTSATVYVRPSAEKAAKNPGSDASEPMSFEEYKAFVAEYTLEKTAEMTGVPKDQLEQLAQLYADPNKKVISYWTMGFNQHTRGVGQQPGLQPAPADRQNFPAGLRSFSLTGQPSACGDCA